MKITSWVSVVFAIYVLFVGENSGLQFSVTAAAAEPERAQITLLYDAFGKPSNLQKDWGFAAFIEYGGKRILVDTGNNAEIFAHNVKAKGIDLSRLDFAVLTHRHGDHSSGLSYLLEVNPNVKIYVPKENFGVFGAELPGTFLKANPSLPSEMRYFDGQVPDTLRFGTPWPRGNFQWVIKSAQIAPGLHLILLKGSWGVDLDVMEISLAMETPEGTVLVVGCSHPTVEKIVEATKAVIDKPIHLIMGGFHLLPAKEDEIVRIAQALHNHWQVEFIAPVHCTGEAAFAILKKTFGDHYVYGGLGTTVLLGSTISTIWSDGEPHAQSMEDADLSSYRMLMGQSDDLYAREHVFLESSRADP